MFSPCFRGVPGERYDILLTLQGNVSCNMPVMSNFWYGTFTVGIFRCIFWLQFLSPKEGNSRSNFWINPVFSAWLLIAT